MRAAVTRGLAPGYDVTRALSANATRRGALQTRPCTRITRRTDPDRTGFYVGDQVGRRRRLYAGYNDNLLIVAPPQSFKTGLVARLVSYAPGGGLVTSTRPDIFAKTKAYRDHLPIEVANPEGLGSIPSTVRFGPQYGCADPEEAFSRSAYLVGGITDKGTSGDRKYWEGRATTFLRYLLHAADIGNVRMSTLAGWVRNPQSVAPGNPEEILRENEQRAAPGWASALAGMRNSHERTIKGITDILAQALAFMEVPALLPMVDCAREEHFDATSLILDRGMIYLLGTDRPHGPLAPLYAALTGYVRETAKWIADRSPNNRLDPPFSFYLDEAYNVSPVPIHKWTGVSGGSGMPVITVVQSYDNLEDWGTDEANMIQTNSTVHIIGGGIPVAKRLNDLTTVIGERADEKVTASHDKGDSVTTDRRPVLTASEIREQEPGHAIVLHRTTGAVRARIECIWDCPPPQSKAERMART